MILRLLFKLDKWAHLAGAFMLTTIALRFTDPATAVIFIAIGAIALEAYQWQFKPDYVGKEMDTALDLIADAAGIVLAVSL